MNCVIYFVCFICQLPWEGFPPFHERCCKNFIKNKYINKYCPGKIQVTWDERLKVLMGSSIQPESNYTMAWGLRVVNNIGKWNIISPPWDCRQPPLELIGTTCRSESHIAGVLLSLGLHLSHALLIFNDSLSIVHLEQHWVICCCYLQQACCKS